MFSERIINGLGCLFLHKRGILLEISVIASGSNGNCCLVEDKGNSILIDAGKSGREIEKRMNSLGKSLENVDACIITHAHADHIQGAGVIARRYDIPLYINKQVCSECGNKIGKADVKQFEGNFKIKNTEIKPIITSHNVTSSGFMIGNFGLFTDTGIVTKQMEFAMKKLKAVLLESNHDVDMVKNGPYPYFLKNWILSEIGHLSNENASRLINKDGKNISLALLGHLSGNNNTPAVASSTFESIVRRKIECAVCSRDKQSGSWQI